MCLCKENNNDNNEINMFNSARFIGSFLEYLHFYTSLSPCCCASRETSPGANIFEKTDIRHYKLLYQSEIYVKICHKTSNDNKTLPDSLVPSEKTCIRFHALIALSISSLHPLAAKQKWKELIKNISKIWQINWLLGNPTCSCLIVTLLC